MKGICCCCCCWIKSREFEYQRVMKTCFPEYFYCFCCYQLSIILNFFTSNLIITYLHVSLAVVQAELVSEIKLRWFTINWYNLLDCLSSQRINCDFKVRCGNLKSKDFMAFYLYVNSCVLWSGQRGDTETKNVQRRGM